MGFRRALEFVYPRPKSKVYDWNAQVVSRRLPMHAVKLRGSLCTHSQR